MLCNLSYNTDHQHTEIIDEIGEILSIKERKAFGNNLSLKLFIIESSVTINNLLLLNRDINTCQIEIRKKGIVIKFFVLCEIYGLVIPFYKLSINKGNVQEYTFYKDHHFIKISAKTKQIHQFIKSIKNFKIDCLDSL